MQMFQKGRSMIEMLGVLAIIGVMSIGGIVLYRRAVNNHQANTILDDVNRFAFVILERSGLALGEVIPKGDFVESGIYNLRGYQSEEAQGFSITVQNVPKGVCEALLPKAVLEYKVGVVTAGGSVNDEVIYDTLNTDLCQDTNDIAFYFGDTSGVCNEPDESGYTPCTQNSDCCGDYFCAFPNPKNCNSKGSGICVPIAAYGGEIVDAKGANGITTRWIRSTINDSPYGKMTWWTADNWCRRQKRLNGSLMALASATDMGCGYLVTDKVGGSCSAQANNSFGQLWSEWSSYGEFHWLNDSYSSCHSYAVIISSHWVSNQAGRHYYDFFALCH